VTERLRIVVGPLGGSGIAEALAAVPGVEATIVQSPAEMPEVDPADVGLWKLWHLPHVAYCVDDLAKAIEGEEVVFGPFEPGDFGSVVFIHKDGVVVEYLEYTTLDLWFGQRTPWRPAGP